MRDRRRARHARSRARRRRQPRARLSHVPDGYFDGLADRLRADLGATAAFVTLLNDHTQTAKGMSGLPADRRVLPLDFSTCQFVVVGGRPLEFVDTRIAPELAACSAAEQVGAYLDVPIQFEGQRVGAVGVIDHAPRPDLTGSVGRLQPYVDKVERELDRRSTIRRRSA